MRPQRVLIKSTPTKCELLLILSTAYLAYPWRTRGAALRRERDYTEVWIMQRASGVTAFGPETVEGPNNPASHAAELPDAAGSLIQCLQTDPACVTRLM